MIYLAHMFPGLDLYNTGPAQYPMKGGQDLSDLDDLSVDHLDGLSVRCVQGFARSAAAVLRLPQ